MFPPVSAQVRSFILDTHAQGLTELGTLGGDTLATAIKAAGQVVGWSGTAAGNTHAFITGPDGGGMTDLGTLVGRDDGSGESRASDINDAGQVVGGPIRAQGGTLLLPAPMAWT